MEYTKARTIARVKDDQQRDNLLEQAIAQNLSLNQIKTRIKQLKPKSEEALEKVFIDRLAEISKQLKKNKLSNDSKKRG